MNKKDLTLKLLNKYLMKIDGGRVTFKDRTIIIKIGNNEKNIFCTKLALKQLIRLILKDEIKNYKEISPKAKEVKSDIERKFKKKSSDFKANLSEEEIQNLELKIMNKNYKLETEILEEYIEMLKKVNVNNVDSIKLKSLNKVKIEEKKSRTNENIQKFKKMNTLGLHIKEKSIKYYDNWIEEFNSADRFIIYKRNEKASLEEKESIKLILESIFNDRHKDMGSITDLLGPYLDEEIEKKKFLNRWENDWIDEWNLEKEIIKKLRYQDLCNLNNNFEIIRKFENYEGIVFEFISVYRNGRLIDGFKYKYKQIDRAELHNLDKTLNNLKIKYDKITKLNEKFDSLYKKPIKNANAELNQFKREYSNLYNNLEEERFKKYYNDISEIEKFKKNYKKMDIIINLSQKITVSINNNQVHKLIEYYDSKMDYFSLYEIKNLIEEFKKTFEEIKYILTVPKEFLEYDEDAKVLNRFLNIYEGLLNYDNISDSDEENPIRQHNEAYLDKEIKKNSFFFENIDGKEIDDITKKRAVIYDEGDLRIVAGAGTGKTFTLQSKVKYLIERKGVSPEKILCLCYTGKGAKDLDNKVNKVLSDENKVGVYTFHGFCRNVDKLCGGVKYTNRYLLDDIIRDYFKENLEDTEKIQNILEYFAYYFPPATERKFNSKEEWEEYEQDKRLYTLKGNYEATNANHYQNELKEYYRSNRSYKQTFDGEIVKSYEELMIANYLFIHDIDYEYEKPYPYNSYYKVVRDRFLDSGKFLSLKDITTSKKQTNRTIVNDFICWEYDRRKYRPDFYLSEKDIYLEHFGKDEDGEIRWLEGEAAEKYKREMESKIEWHKIYGTKLIETYSYYNQQGILFDKLEELLRKNGIEIGKRDHKEILDRILKIRKTKMFRRFSDLIKAFINIFEAKDNNLEDFKEFRRESNDKTDAYTRRREEIFFDIAEEIYAKYIEYTQGDEIDHNREITNAIDLIESGKFDRNYDYILIDEYQDINYIRTKLIQKLKDKTNAKVFVVGDDWQSIYKFNGSDVNLFIDFNDYFNNAETIKIEKSRRNSQEINDISSKFILKNENQIRKRLRHYKEDEINYKPIKIVRYPENEWDRYNNQKPLHLRAIIEYILKNNKKPNLEILILGRQNNSIDKYVNNRLFTQKKKQKYSEIRYFCKPNVNIKFMSVHQSKGLEADEVIVINLKNELLGFPSQIEDDPILNYLKSPDEYPYAEERRLFYVALTRTKNNVFLMSTQDRDDESEFITEIKTNGNVEELYLRIDKGAWFRGKTEELIHHPTGIKCPNCDGEIVVVENTLKGTTYFRCDHCDADLGPYMRDLKDIKYVEKCPECRGMLIKTGNRLQCCLNKYGCTVTKKLDLDKEEMEDDPY